MCAWTRTALEILKFKIVHHKSVDQGRGVQFPQWYHSMENINIYTSTLYFYIFSLVLTVVEILSFQICDLENVGQGYGIQLSKFDDKHENLLKSFFAFFSLTFSIWKILVSKCWPWRSRLKLKYNFRNDAIR